MRAYKIMGWLTNIDGLPNFYHKDKIQKIEELGFKREFWNYIKVVWDLRIWLDTIKWGYIDYQDVWTWNRIAPNQINAKHLWNIIKTLKEIWVIKYNI